MPTEKFGPTQRLQRSYAQGIRRIAGRILQPKLPEQTLAEWLQTIVERSQAADVQEASAHLSREMFRWANVGNQRTWREAAAKSQKSRMLYKYLQQELTNTAVGGRVAQLIAQNAGYISSLPQVAARTVVDEVTRAQQAGARPATMDKMLRARFPKLLRSRVHLISRTETSKASAALTRARSEDLDLPCYIWRTSKDARVRDSHRLMDGVLVFWSDPPSPEALDGVKSGLGHYHAGEAPNDRCYSEPVLSFDDIRFPTKVYVDGAIKYMGKQEFLKRFAAQRAAD
jgi:SPP1 gp7 family putative phage head morphogenesis protein